MNLKKMECRNCGGTLKFNNRTHEYVCEYCSSTYKDTKASKERNAKIEIDPTELDTLAPQDPIKMEILNEAKSEMKKSVGIVNAIITTAVILIITTVVIFIVLGLAVMF